MAFTPFTEEDRPTMAAFNQKFLDAIDEAVSKGIKVEIGSYVGTGTHGKGAPSSIKFSGNPFLVVITPAYKDTSVTKMGDLAFFWPSSILSTYKEWAYLAPTVTSTGNSMFAKFDKESHTLSWYSTTFGNKNNYQLDVNGATYNYFAFIEGVK